MKYLLVLLLCILATTKVSFQSAFSKKSVRNLADTVLFNCLIFAATSLLFLKDIFGAPWQIWALASIYSLFTMIFQITYTLALSSGNVSVTVMLISLNMIFPVIASVIFFDDSLSLLRCAGIVLTLSTFVIGTEFRSENKASVKWLLLSVSAMVATGLSSVVQKFFAASEFGKMSGEFIACSYVLAAVYASLLYLFIKGRGIKRTFKGIGSAAKYALLTGITLSIFQWLNNYTVRTVEGTFVFPTYSGGSILLSSIAGVILFKDRLKKKHVISIILGIVAIVLMNF